MADRKVGRREIAVRQKELYLKLSKSGSTVGENEKSNEDWHSKVILN